MDIKSQLPALNIADLTDGDTIKELKYRIGKPRPYRFNASTGIVNINGEVPLTKPGDHFRLIPVAWRIVKDDLFNKGEKNWAELFFINRSGVMCSIMAHGFSVENLGHLESELYYDDLTLGDIVLTIKPEQKEKKGTGEKYYIAKWSYEEADKQVVKEMKNMVDGLQIYREDTAQGTARYIVSENYYHSPNLISSNEPEPETAQVEG